MESVACVPKRQKISHDFELQEDAKLEAGNKTIDISFASGGDLETKEKARPDNKNIIDLAMYDDAEVFFDQVLTIPDGGDDDTLDLLGKLFAESDEQDEMLKELSQREHDPRHQAERKLTRVQNDDIGVTEQYIVPTQHLSSHGSTNNNLAAESRIFQPFASLPSTDQQTAVVQPPSQQVTWDAGPTIIHKPRDKRMTIVRASLRYSAPTSLSTGTDQFLQPASFTTGDECPICMGDFRTMPTVKLTKCKHLYHRECIEEALKYCPRCPTCRLEVIEPRGKSPSGTMHIKHSRQHCGGLEDADGSIVIHYRLDSGYQQEYHDNPGVQYHGTSRCAYLPNNEEGRELLKRLKYAWMHGLSFAIGTSLTTGRPNTITWSSIHHKTNLRGGVHGFPDPNFFTNCSEELDALGVPDSRDLD